MMALHISTHGLSIPNEIAAAYLIDTLHRAARLEQARRDATITLPRADYSEMPAHVDGTAMKRGRK